MSCLLRKSYNWLLTYYLLVGCTLLVITLVGHTLTAGYVMANFFEFTNLDYNRVIRLQVQCNYNERISSFSFITNTKDYQTKGAIQGIFSISTPLSENLISVCTRMIQHKHNQRSAYYLIETNNGKLGEPGSV